MSHWDENRLPDDLQRVADRLRDERTEASALELDQIKLRARRQSSGSAGVRPKGFVLRSRVLTVFVVVGLMAGTTGGVIATGGGGGGGSSAKSQYKPGCGPKKSDGVNPSGTHTGQPGKDPNRGDCPQ